jgi:solute carrier family 25 (mitochondrial oxoglutarate transporter), member 11
MQKGATNPLTMGRKVLAEEGVRALYSGLDSALLRQATYTTARLGIYRSLFDMREKHYGGALPFYEKVGVSMIAGLLGSIVGNPADLALIRLQADQTLAPEQRRNYKNVVDAFQRIVKEEGVLALWKGSVPTVARAMSLNAGQLATFEELK